MSTTMTLLIEPPIPCDHPLIMGEISSGHTAPAAAANIIKQQWKIFDTHAFQRDTLDSQL